MQLNVNYLIMIYYKSLFIIIALLTGLLIRSVGDLVLLRVYIYLPRSDSVLLVLFSVVSVCVCVCVCLFVSLSTRLLNCLRYHHEGVMGAGCGQKLGRV